MRKLQKNGNMYFSQNFQLLLMLLGKRELLYSRYNGVPEAINCSRILSKSSIDKLENLRKFQIVG